MATHELKTPTPEFDRVVSGRRPWAITQDVHDFQTGDTVDLVEVNDRGFRVRGFVERDDRWRFVNTLVDRPAVLMLVTHVGRSMPGLIADRVVLSLAPTAEAA